jgi:hypothetical protein
MRRKFKISHFTSEGISSSYYEGSCLVVKFAQEGHFYPQLLVLRRIIETQYMGYHRDSDQRPQRTGLIFV